jgi:hypothetical protein
MPMFWPETGESILKKRRWDPFTLSEHLPENIT